MVHLAAIRTAWSQMGAFWVSNAPFEIKRQLFLAKVLGAALSGCEVLVPTALDLHTWSVVVLKFARIMHMGRARFFDADKVMAWRSLMIWESLHRAPLDVEFRICRL